MSDLNIKIEKIQREFFPKIKKILNKFPVVHQSLAMYYALIDEETPISVKVSIAGALLYFILPFDVIPDFIVGSGFIDDVGLILFVWNKVSPHITEKHKQKAKEFLEDNQNNF